MTAFLFGLTVGLLIGAIGVRLVYVGMKRTMEWRERQAIRYSQQPHEPYDNDVVVVLSGNGGQHGDSEGC